MLSCVQFDDDVYVDEENLENAAQSVIRTMVNELPENARRLDVCREVLKRVKQRMYAMKVSL